MQFFRVTKFVKNDLNQEDVMKELNQLRDFYNFEHVVTTGLAAFYQM